MDVGRSSAGSGGCELEEVRRELNERQSTPVLYAHQDG